MSQTVNPIGYRISVVKTWFSIIHYPINYASDFLFIDNHIRKLVYGIMIKYRVLTSEIVINYLPDTIVIRFTYYKYKRERKIKPLIYLLKLLLRNITGKKIFIVALRVPSFLYSAKILTEYIKFEHARWLRRPRNIFKNILIELKKIQRKKRIRRYKSNKFV